LRHTSTFRGSATGAANVALIGLLASLRPEANLLLSKTIAQGIEMGRPEHPAGAGREENGAVTATWIGGRCVPVMSGTIDLV
jgi:trans-2,3-dihydro-3-hydroxyanthranilate isomerase